MTTTATTTAKLTRKRKRMILRLFARMRERLSAHAAMPIEIVDDGSAPELVGERCHWRTRGGSAYPSTRRVRVGADWLTLRCPIGVSLVELLFVIDDARSISISDDAREMFRFWGSLD